MKKEKRLIDLNDVFPNNMMLVITGDPWLTLQKLLDRINKAPVIDVVEKVVYCKDCKYFRNTDRLGSKLRDCVCKYWGSDGMEYDDFCSYGERKTDNGK